MLLSKRQWFFAGLVEPLGHSPTDSSATLYGVETPDFCTFGWRAKARETQARESKKREKEVGGETSLQVHARFSFHQSTQTQASRLEIQGLRLKGQTRLEVHSYKT